MCSSALGVTEIDITLTNDGDTEVALGTLIVAGSGTSGGSFLVDSGATLQITGNPVTLSAPSSVSGQGTVWVNGGTLAVNGNYSLTGSGLTPLSRGTLTLNSSSPSTARFLMSGGTLNRARTLTLAR